MIDHFYLCHFKQFSVVLKSGRNKDVSRSVVDDSSQQLQFFDEEKKCATILKGNVCLGYAFYLKS